MAVKTAFLVLGSTLPTLTYTQVPAAIVMGWVKLMATKGGLECASSLCVYP